MCHEEINIKYSEKELIKCCNLIAEDLELSKPYEDNVVEKLREVLVRRENYASMENGPITLDELAHLIFQHLDCLVRKGLDSTYSKAFTKESEIHAKIKRALLHFAT